MSYNLRRWLKGQLCLISMVGRMDEELGDLRDQVVSLVRLGIARLHNGEIINWGLRTPVTRQRR